MRYLLDTNVVSELRKGAACATAVTSWANGVRSEDLALSVLVVGEIRHGIEVVRRRGDDAQAEIFSAWLTRLKAEFSDRLIPLSQEIAERWGEIRGRMTIAPVDGLMTATALEYDLTFVTRDVAALRRTGVRLLNPWDH